MEANDMALKYNQEAKLNGLRPYEPFSLASLFTNSIYLDSDQKVKPNERDIIFYICKYR